MTSAPVKDVSSLMNFVGNRAAATSGIGADGASGFGDVMSKASESRQNPPAERVEASENVKETRVDKSHTHPKRAKVETDKKAVKTEAGKEDVENAVNEAGRELVKETAEKLGVSEEEVLAAMEALGFSMESLFHAENLTQLVLTVTGSDSLSLLTDEGLYGSLQDLLATMQDMQSRIQETFSMSPEEMGQLLEEMSAKSEMPENLTGGQMETNADILNQNQDVPEENAKVTVTVEEGTQSVKLVTDEHGNVKQVETVTAKENGSQQEQNAGENHQEGQMEKGAEGMQTGTVLNDVMSNKVLNAEMTFEQTAAYMAPDTEQIMNQILDYMKIQLKPGMSQLEMQLHPESLGTLHIQLTSKGGEVTAQFQVQNETVKAALESQMMELKDTLREQGVKVEAVEVMVESHAFEQNLWQGQGREEESYRENKKSPRRINLNALEEGFEEEASEEEILAAKMMEANGNTVDYTA